MVLIGCGPFNPEDVDVNRPKPRVFELVPVQCTFSKTMLLIQSHLWHPPCVWGGNAGPPNAETWGHPSGVLVNEPTWEHPSSHRIGSKAPPSHPLRPMPPPVDAWAPTSVDLRLPNLWRGNSNLLTSKSEKRFHPPKNTSLKTIPNPNTRGHQASIKSEPRPF